MEIQDYGRSQPPRVNFDSILDEANFNSKLCSLLIISEFCKLKWEGISSI